MWMCAIAGIGRCGESGRGLRLESDRVDATSARTNPFEEHHNVGCISFVPALLFPRRSLMNGWFAGGRMHKYRLSIQAILYRIRSSPLSFEVPFLFASFSFFFRNFLLMHASAGDPDMTTEIIHLALVNSCPAWKAMFGDISASSQTIPWTRLANPPQITTSLEALVVAMTTEPSSLGFMWLDDANSHGVAYTALINQAGTVSASSHRVFALLTCVSHSLLCLLVTESVCWC